MAYTPELSRRHVIALRRIAWANGRPMTKTLGEIIEYMSQVVDSRKVCQSCQDKSKCNCCILKKN